MQRIPELMPQIRRLTWWALGLGLVCGAAFTLGALFYALKKPLMLPGVFSFHELFHVMVLIGAGCHYAMIYIALPGAAGG